MYAQCSSRLFFHAVNGHNRLDCRHQRRSFQIVTTIRLATDRPQMTCRRVPILPSTFQPTQPPVLMYPRVCWYADTREYLNRHLRLQRLQHHTQVDHLVLLMNWNLLSISLKRLSQPVCFLDDPPAHVNLTRSHMDHLSHWQTLPPVPPHSLYPHLKIVLDTPQSQATKGASLMLRRPVMTMATVSRRNRNQHVRRQRTWMT